MLTIVQGLQVLDITLGPQAQHNGDTEGEQKRGKLGVSTKALGWSENIRRKFRTEGELYCHMPMGILFWHRLKIRGMVPNGANFLPVKSNGPNHRILLY